MNIKKILVFIIAISAFAVGCNSNRVKQESTINKEAIYQETMTKVQNDVSEIIDKEYEYVINNMGTPYCTTYYIDTEEIRDLDIIDENQYVENMRLVYPKYTSDHKLEGSALYIDIENYKVSDVQTYELSDYDKEIENQANKPDIILNKYSEEINLPLEKAENIDFETFINQNEKEVLKAIGNIKPNFEGFELNTNEKVKIYMLNKIKSGDNKLLIIYADSDIVKDIAIVNNNIVNLVNAYLKK